MLALEFHHRDPAAKSFPLGGFSGSQRRFEIEALKCDLICANCHRNRHALEDDKSGAKQVEFRRRTKLRAVRLHGATCYACDGGFPPPVFEFHHWDGKTKEFGVAARGVTRPWDDVVSELAKCVMLCANCHREVHAGVRELDDGLLGLAEDAVRYAA
ncbi:MAG: hypothetical protein M3R54_00835 [Chloroflexota bacterium]|nr:hypothetical protein [Chloroflexota bacterium]